MVVASLAHEHITFPNEPILEINLVSRGVIFIQQGVVSMAHIEMEEHPIVNLCEGSYFGDVSYIFKLLNRFSYKIIQNSKENEKQCRLFSLKDKYIKDIFERFPDFENVFKVRALRRHHYFRKIK